MRNLSPWRRGAKELNGEAEQKHDGSVSVGQLSVTANNQRAILVTFGLTFTYFLVEVVGGLWTNSLALLADAAHMLTDVGGLALGLFAAWMPAKPTATGKMYGYYRGEIFAALATAAVLFLMSFYILYEAFRRFQEPPEVQSTANASLCRVRTGRKSDRHLATAGLIG